MFSGIGGPTALVIIFIVLLLFGAPKLPALARSLGQSMKILKKEVAPGDKPNDVTNSDTANEGNTVKDKNNTSEELSVEEQLAQAKAEAEAARAEADALKQQTTQAKSSQENAS